MKGEVQQDKDSCVSEQDWVDGQEGPGLCFQSHPSSPLHHNHHVVKHRAY